MRYLMAGTLREAEPFSAPPSYESFVNLLVSETFLFNLTPHICGYCWFSIQFSSQLSAKLFDR